VQGGGGGGEGAHQPLCQVRLVLPPTILHTTQNLFSRVTAIKAMERAGMDLGTISKITGHKKIETIVQNYSLSLEVRKLVKLTKLYFLLEPRVY
jgi:hypothetical protein